VCQRVCNAPLDCADQTAIRRTRAPSPPDPLLPLPPPPLPAPTLKTCNDTPCAATSQVCVPLGNGTSYECACAEGYAPKDMNLTEGEELECKREAIAYVSCTHAPSPTRPCFLRQHPIAALASTPRCIRPVAKAQPASGRLPRTSAHGTAPCF
jgi:hypothetical protein